MSLPNIHLTPTAIESCQGAFAPGEGEWLHLQITDAFGHDIFIGPRAEGDIEINVSGVSLLLDAGTAERAEGLKIDFVVADHSGFRFSNPNAPVKVVHLPARELKALLDRGDLEFYDARTEEERTRAPFALARPLDAAGEQHLRALDRSKPIAFVGIGTQGRNAGQRAIELGFRDVYNVRGGIDAWSFEVDHTAPAPRREH